MSDKILWNLVRTKTAAWKHVRMKLDGDRDLCICKLCGHEEPLADRFQTKDSILRYIARTHYYKHKVWETFSEDVINSIAA